MKTNLIGKRSKMTTGKIILK